MPKKHSVNNNNHHKHISLQKELRKNDFRISIFGSARVKSGNKIYKDTFKLAKEIAKHGFDIVTGGGPGLMEAANKGHEEGDINDILDSIGLKIELPWENKINPYVEIKKTFKRFSERLDNFMKLSCAVVIMPGGVGTCLEFFYTWQLVQVHHICPIPVILVGEMWKKLIEWARKYPLKNGFINEEEFGQIYLAKDVEDAIKIIIKTYKVFKKEGENYCTNIKKYKLN
ncbi:LOG family protein [Candidatus Peregrinibacteria bacterium]|nr:LOG family protein [Candidatus Peregrinibacteria bacterium]